MYTIHILLRNILHRDIQFLPCKFRMHSLIPIRELFNRECCQKEWKYTTVTALVSLVYQLSSRNSYSRYVFISMRFYSCTDHFITAVVLFVCKVLKRILSYSVWFFSQNNYSVHGWWTEIVMATYSTFHLISSAHEWN